MTTERMLRLFIYGLSTCLLSALLSCGHGKSPLTPPDYGEINLQSDAYRVSAPVDMVQIPGGSFIMGLDSIGTNSGPAHPVSLDPFSMSIDEITNLQFSEYLNAVLRAGGLRIDTVIGQVFTSTGRNGGRLLFDLGLRFPEEQRTAILYSGGKFSVKIGGDQRPVTWVTWYGAAAFAEFHKMRLPSEAEWEYAAKGGENLTYATEDGKLDPSKSRYDRINGLPDKVGSYPANPFGVHDLTGNVAEWCQDWVNFSYYSVSPEHNPTGPVYGTYKIVRGGSWKSGDISTRNDYRWYAFPEGGDPEIGIRLVKSAAAP